MSPEFITVERRDSAVYIVLNRPEVLNAITNAMLKEIASTLESIEADETVKVVVIKGAGRAFCSGRDLGEMAARVAEERPNERVANVLYSNEHHFHAGVIRRLCDVLWRSPVVSIAQIHGACVQGGWVVAAFADLAVAADDARIIWRPIGGAGMAFHLWPYTIGLRKTKEMLFSGEAISGKEAASLGMINRSVPAEVLDQTVSELAAKIARRPREFLFLDKKVTNQAFEMMGLWNALDYSITSHVISRSVNPSKDLVDALGRQSTRQIKDMLDSRTGVKTQAP